MTAGTALSLTVRRGVRYAPAVTVPCLAGCEGPQSALSAAGAGAEAIAGLFWAMAIAAAAIWLAVMGLAFYATRLRPGHAHDVRLQRRLVLWAGGIVPTVLLGGLLGYSLPLIPRTLPPPPEAGIRLSVSGERWWWRVAYEGPDGGRVELANELRLPAGVPAEVTLTSPDVIHSFWVPSLAGKIDMIPGRTNRMVLEPTATGTFRGACAEFCGAAHAFMAFMVVVMPPEDFAAWLAAQAAPAAVPEDAQARRGAELFQAHGCGACHAVRGTPADGVIGPDLTHVGGRLTIGAGMLPTTRAALRRWIAHTGAVKPEVTMPSFGMLPDADLAALAAYLEGLR